MYSRDEAKAITDKIINMAKAEAVEVDLSGGERSGTRWANSTITTNLVQYDRNVSVTLYKGQRSGFASTRDFSDAGLQAMIAAAAKSLESATDMANAPTLMGPQEYIPVDGASPSVINFGPAERAQMVKDSIAVSDKLGTDGSGYIPISRMIRYGFLLDMIGLIVIVATVRLLVPLTGIAMTAAP